MAETRNRPTDNYYGWEEGTIRFQDEDEAVERGGELEVRGPLRRVYLAIKELPVSAVGALRRIFVPSDQQIIGDGTADWWKEEVARGGPGSGHFEHEGREGKVGGSQPGEGPRRVGLTTARPGKPSAEVFQQMRDFRDNLVALEGVSDAVVAPGLGGWNGGQEPTWVVEYNGNGEAERLIAQIAKDNEQDGVLLIDPCDPPPDCSPVVDFHFDDPVTPSERNAVENMLVAKGIEGWTWYRREGQSSSLRAIAVPDWGGESKAHLEATNEMRFLLDQAGMPHVYAEESASISVMNKEGENSYDDFLG